MPRTLLSSLTAPAQPGPVVIVGAGPAGLTAALQLAEMGVPVVVFEADKRVGGLAQTVEFNGFRFDLGGHRFFTKIPAVADLWRDVLGADFLRRRRLSRILYRGRFFDYPLKPLNALRQLGPVASVHLLASYLWSTIRPIRPEVSFEDWVTNRFGRELYRTFFQSYTEKVWGIPCRMISARWAAQRIRGLSLRTALVNMLVPWLNRRPGREVKSLIDEFDYPRLGPGMMWEAFAARIERLGGSVHLRSRVVALVHDGSRLSSVEFERDGRRIRQPAAHVISTMPLTHLVRSLGAARGSIGEAVGQIKYRAFITVAVVVNRAHLFPDNWIYVHDPRVRIGRIQNFKNWSPDMVPDPSTTCLGLEYFCTAGDSLWSMTDDALIALAKTELARLGLVEPELVSDATVVRVPNAYPVYDAGYEGAVEMVRDFVTQFPNLQTIGRNGTHTYNNQDHSMVMGMLAVRNLLGEHHNLWALDSQDEYLEELRDGSTGPALSDIRKLASTQPLSPPTLVGPEAYQPQ
jgi:protoporphyrinogen oxidase